MPIMVDARVAQYRVERGWRRERFRRLKEMTNRCVIGGVVLACLLLPTAVMRTPDDSGGAPPPFPSWRIALVEEAVARGFERPLVEEALGDLQPSRRVLQLDRTQAQTPAALAVYLSERVTPELIARGRDMMTRHDAVLTDIERAFGVQREFLVAIWGAESGYGRYTGDVPVFQALATLAWDRRRSMYFRSELFNALAVLRAGHIGRDRMTGSWAGAMGQPQFMPSSYLEYAVDFDRDGRTDIWDSAADTLASIARYLQRHGWEWDMGWGEEVTLTPAVRAAVERESPRRTSGCGAIRALTEPRAVGEWRGRGVRPVEGTELPRDPLASSLVYVEDRAFLVSRNYETVLQYNCSHRYALSVSMLADGLQ
jgi:peptidoglycan lytic transglycosylase B